MTTYEFLTVAEAARLIKQRRLSPVELTTHLLRRIESLDSGLDSFISVTSDHALAQARQAEAEIFAGNYRGPLHGIPFGLKDIVDTAGILTSGSSRTTIDRIPSTDAAAVTKLYAAGGVLLGKLATHEHAYGGPSFDLPWPPARNPWDRTRFTGGSSSGSAAAVAAGFVLGALGSDTGGSIRTPAAYCGVAGLKPTYGLVSCRGVIPNCFTLDHCGPLCWTAEDCALMLTAIAGFDPADPASADWPTRNYVTPLIRGIKGLKIGVLRHFFEVLEPLNAEMASAFDAAVAAFADLGAAVEEAQIDPPQAYHDVKLVIACSELVSVHREALTERPSDFGVDFLGRILPGCLFSAADYVGAQRLRRQLLVNMESVYRRYDVLLAPVTNGPAPPLAPNRTIDFWRKPNATTPFNVTGGPALSICAGFSDTGLPLAIQLVGRPFDDATVLRAAHAYERATAWREQRPKLSAKSPPLDGAKARYRSQPDLDAKTRSLADALAFRYGLRLNDEQTALLYEAAPYALAMAQRMRGPFGWNVAPTNLFSFPRHGSADSSGRTSPGWT